MLSAMNSIEANKAAARGFFETAEHGDLDALDALVSPDYVLHDPSMPEDVRGVEGAKQMVEKFRNAFGLRVAIEHQFADGEYVVTRYTARGRHDADFMGVPPTGRDVTVTGICISRCRDGKIVEEWDAWDALGALQQVGGLPETTP
jgi:steroid delta-isomerase-like uncharacterized protein